MTQLRAASAARASAAGRPRRRGRWWWLAVLAVAIAAAVITDLTGHSTSGYRQQQLRSYLASTEADVAQCQDGLRDAVKAFTSWQSGAGSRATARTFTGQAIAVCGFADADVVALTSTQPPRAVASPVVNRLAPQLGTWAYLDAFNFLQDLRVVIAHPASAAARQHANADLAALAAQRGVVDGLVGRAERAGHLRAGPAVLLQVGKLLQGGRLSAAPGAGR